MAYSCHIHISFHDFVLNKSEFVSKKPHANKLPRYTRYIVEYISDFIVKISQFNIRCFVYSSGIFKNALGERTRHVPGQGPNPDHSRTGTSQTSVECVSSDFGRSVGLKKVPSIEQEKSFSCRIQNNKVVFNCCRKPFVFPVKKVENGISDSHLEFSVKKVVYKSDLQEKCIFFSLK